MLSDYLQYDLYHSIGAYGIASDRLINLEAEMQRSHTAEADDIASRSALEQDKLLRVTRITREYNEKLVQERHFAHRSVTDSSRSQLRHPIPDELPLTLRERFDFDDEDRGVQDARRNPWASPIAWVWVVNFYDGAIAAITRKLMSRELRKLTETDARAARLAVYFAESMVWPRDRPSGQILSDRELWLRCKRFIDRRDDALQKLPGVPRETPHRSDDAIEFLHRLTTDHLGSGYGSVPLFVISALAEAHLSMHAVEGWKSLSLNAHASNAARHLDRTEKNSWLMNELDRCIVLNTFVYCASRSAPWMFAQDASECELVFWDFPNSWMNAVPARCMWISAQISLLALHRRAYSYALKGERVKAYNDYHKLQRQIRNARRRVEWAPVHVAGALEFLTFLDARAHQNIGELYRDEHAQKPALKHFQTALERLETIPLEGKFGDVLTNSRWYVKLQISQGKASYELGRHKDCLRLHLHGLCAFLKLLAAETGTETGTDTIDRAIEWLDGIKFEPELRKSEVQTYLRPIVDQLGRIEVPERFGALAAEILLLLGHVLFVIDLGRGGEHPALPSGERRQPKLAKGEVMMLPAGPGSKLQPEVPEPLAATLSFGFLRKAAECDPYSTLVGADLLKSSLRFARWFRPEGLPVEYRQALAIPPIAPIANQWPRGGDDYERIARVTEYLTLLALDLNRVHPSDRSSRDHEHEVTIARDLLLNFLMHTDSINVRKAQTHHFLMKGPTDSAPPCLLDRPPKEPEDQGNATTARAVREHEKREAVVKRIVRSKKQIIREPAIEFICMRRYSSAFPLLPRPAAFRAHGGGYLVRLHPACTSKPNDHPAGDCERPFGIAVDPGFDFIENLYRTGFSLSDIQMIIVTHDHADHLNSLEALLALLHYRDDLLHTPQPLIYGNVSIRRRYEPVERLSTKDRFKDLETLNQDDLAKVLPPDFTIVAMSSKELDGTGHEDLSKEPSQGICFRYRTADKQLSLAITSDTPSPPDKSKSKAKRRKWKETWKEALDADVLVTHLSTVPLPELRQIAKLDARLVLRPSDLKELVARIEVANTQLVEMRSRLDQIMGKIKAGIKKAKEDNQPKAQRDLENERKAVKEVRQCVRDLHRALRRLNVTAGQLGKEAMLKGDATQSRDRVAEAETLVRRISRMRKRAVQLGRRGRELRSALELLPHKPILLDQLARLGVEAEELALYAQHPHCDAETLEEIRCLLEDANSELAGRIKFAMWLGSDWPGPTADLTGLVPDYQDDLTRAWRPPPEHPYLRGVLAWARAYRKARRPKKKKVPSRGLLVLGELSEELGTVRGKIAGRVNETLFKHGDGSKEQQHLRALTSDVGLQIFVVADEKRQRGRAKILCTTCSLDTDRIPDEVYHTANYISEVCVKGENEGIFYNCDDHDPGAQSEALFLEQLERFDVFGR